jgi:predicted transcriptional regulator
MVAYMMNETTYMPIAVSNETKQRVKLIAKGERRSMSQQAAELVELGLAEYERRQQEAEAVRAGSTQIDTEALDRMKAKHPADTFDGREGA